jgi:ribokinase
MILVFGSVNVDLTFQLTALPAVGETVLTPKFTEAIGGKGANQAVAAKRAGAKTTFVGCIGEDDFGVRAKTALGAEGIDVEALSVVTDKTGLASIFIDAQGQNMIAVASGANALVKSDNLSPSMLTPETMLVLQMEIPCGEIEAVISHAKEREARVLLNLAPALPLSADALSAVDILVLNEHEADTLCKSLSTPVATPEDRVRALSEKLNATVVTTLGVDGVMAMHEGMMHKAKALPVTPVDTTGAGDCFVGVLAAGLDSGLAFGDALERAAAAGSLACTVVGTTPSFPISRQIDEAMARAAENPELP